MTFAPTLRSWNVPQGVASWPAPKSVRAAAADVGLAFSVTTVGVGVPAQAAEYRQARAVDGDTIQLRNGEYARLLGYDTPEVGQCGYAAAKAKVADLLVGGVKLVNKSGTDRHGRILAYVKTDEGWDIGTAMLRSGLAVARYDSRDGYGWHPKQKKHRRLDRHNGTIKCTKPSTPRPTSPAKIFRSCERPAQEVPGWCGEECEGGEAGRSRRTQPPTTTKAARKTYRKNYRSLDRDRDGTACES